MERSVDPHASARSQPGAPAHGPLPGARDRLPADARTSRASILARPEVALVPVSVVAVASFALALSLALRPESAPAAVSALNDDVMLPGAIAYGLLGTGVLVASRRSRAVRALRGWLALYAAVVAFVLVGVTVGGVLDRGVGTLELTALMLVAPYVALVFPLAISRLFLLAAMLALALAHVSNPAADLIAVGSAVAITAAGWVVGLLPRIAHHGAAREALVLSRSDGLTAALNRRGFLEQTDFELAEAARDGRPVALVIIDLNGFKLINDQHGHAAGDELLAWVGERVPQVLPGGAIFGRLGGDEFAVLLPGLTEGAAEAAAAVVHAALAERVGASIGVAHRADGAARSAALLREADLALYAAKADATRRVQVREVLGPPVPASAVPRPQLSYDALRAAGRPTEWDGRSFRVGRTMVIAGWVTIGLAGAAFVLATYLDGEPGFFADLIRWGGPPWVALCLLLAVLMRAHDPPLDDPRSPVYWSSALVVGVGIGTAALSTGDGAATPIIAGLYLKLLFDASIAGRRVVGSTAAIIGVCWALVLALGPPEALWVAPYQLALMGGAVALGAIGRRAFWSATSERLRLALADPLTGLLNRRGFVTRADAVLAVARPGSVGLVAVDLDGFKQLNDTHGHEAGDDLLCAVAALCRATLPQAEAIGRLGGDEFVALVPLGGPAVLGATVAALDEALRAVAPGSVGGATFGGDGVTLDELLGVADGRAYAVKQRRKLGA